MLAIGKTLGERRGSALAEAAESAGVILGFMAFGLLWALWVEGGDGTALAHYAGGVVPPGVESAPPASDPAATPLPRARDWLVDGYNVLHAGLLNREDRSRFWSRAHRERLRARVECFREPGARVWLVFDGDDPQAERSKRGDGPEVHTLFAPSADEWLVRRVREAEDPGELAVVTGDRRVAGRARHRGAQVVSPRLFLAHCGAG